MEFQGYEEILFKIKNENGIEEILGINDPIVIFNIIKDFFLDINEQVLSKSTLDGIRFLIKNHFDFERAF